MITPYKQIHPNQCPTLAKMGYKTLINLRLDDECPKQPTSDTIAQAATLCQMAYYHLPIDMDEGICHNNANAFAKLINESPKPILVFCGSGMRAKKIYQVACVLRLIEGS